MMQIVGITTQQEVYIASRDHKFRINEILVISDESLANPKVEIIETMSYNRLIPMGLDKSLVDAQVLQTLRQIGYDIEADAINLAKARLYEEAAYPVQTGCLVRFPEFNEVRHLLVKSTPDKGMLLGEIRSTDSLYASITDDLRDKVKILEHGQLRQQLGVPFIFDIQSMHQYPHVGVFGGSGSGKSFGLRVMLEELIKLRIPGVVFDPHFEMEFQTGAAGFEEQDQKLSYESVSLQIGKDVGISFCDLSTRDVIELLSASGGHLTESMVNVIQMLHRRKDSFASFSDRLNNLVYALEEKKDLEKQLQSPDSNATESARARDLLKLLQLYGNLPLSSVKGIDWRLQRLERAGLFQHDIQSVVANLERRKLVVIQGSIWLLQIFATYLVGALYRWRREYRDAKMNGEDAKFFPPFVIITDEAHNFAPKATDSPTKSILKEVAQEGRKYGVFLILATQRPALLDETITAQLNTKFIFRTVRGTDIALLREETDLTPEEGKRLPYLSSGDAFVSSAVFGRTLFIRIRASYTSSPHIINPFEELHEIEVERSDKLLALLASDWPILDTNLVQIINKLNREQSLDWDVERLKLELDFLVDQGKIQKSSSPFANKYAVNSEVSLV